MKVFLAIVVILICSQSSFGQKVKGKVIDNSNFPIPGVDIEIEGGGSSKTGKNGEFSVDVNKTPYTITIISKEYSIAVRYEGLKELNPELKLFVQIPQKNSNRQTIRVDLPHKISPEKEAFLQFMSNDIFLSSQRKIPKGRSSVTLDVQWPMGKETIEGYLFYFESSEEQFTNYSYFPVTLQKQNTGLQQRISFPAFYNDYKPGTSIITINPVMFDLKIPTYKLYADFKELGVSSLIEFPIKTESDGKLTVNIPTTLPFNYRLKLRTDLSWKNGKGYTKESYLRPGTATVNTYPEGVLSILSPLDVNIKYDTSLNFSYSKNFGYGVYVVCFYNNPSPFPPPNPANSRYYIVTTMQTIKHPLENSYGILKGNNYIWYVSNYSEFRDVDDFVKPGRSRIDYGETKIIRSERKNLEFTF